jgi:hypothetical protein
MRNVLFATLNTTDPIFAQFNPRSYMDGKRRMFMDYDLQELAFDLVGASLNLVFSPRMAP